VFDTGGSTVVTSAFYGIVTNYSADVLDNTVSGMAATAAGNGNVFAIFAMNNLDGRIIGNGGRGLVADGTGSGFGIYNTASDRITLAGNHMVGDGASGQGMTCASANGSATDNVLSGFSGGISSCSDDGGNVIVP
jgi:hypothetical protein